jgi:uncharacterized integral membrane protein
MKLLIWLIILPMVLVAAFFAIANREYVNVDLWPFWSAVSLPLFVALAGALYLGMAIGAVLAWFGGRKNRIKARAEHRRAEILAHENAALQARIDQLSPKPKPAVVDLTPAPSPPSGTTIPPSSAWNEPTPR